MDDKMKMARFPALPNFGAAIAESGRISPRELMRRKLMRKMITRPAAQRGDGVRKIKLPDGTKDEARQMPDMLFVRSELDR